MGLTLTLALNIEMKGVFNIVIKTDESHGTTKTSQRKDSEKELIS